MLLLSVAIILSIIAALAFVMNRAGAMNAQAVEAQYDTEVARYLAESGLSLAKWRNEQAGCNSQSALAPTSLPGIGSFSATVSRESSRTLDIVSTGTSNRGARFQISRMNVVVHNLGRPTNVTLSGAQPGTISDTYLDSDSPNLSTDGSRYLELTQGETTALLQFSLASIPSGSSIIKADLKLVQYQSNSTQPSQVVSVHRVLRDWDAPAATWASAKLLTPWAVAGGDYGGGNVAVATINGNQSYTWSIVALLDGWVNNTLPNYGLLLKPDGPLQQARFASEENSTSSKPSIDVSYLPPC
ncbi:MAG TPA: DNRLRE domain-containing protein [Rhodocyclaceae bacterium]|nr:DNRLRE domain-containing protein [Rhodocyclaceae bacterium]